jgi:hypothetical protein
LSLSRVGELKNAPSQAGDLVGDPLVIGSQLGFA